MNNKLKKITETFLWYSGLVCVFEKTAQVKGHIIELHRIGDFNYSIKANKNLAISSDYLENIITYLKSKGYSFISLDELLDCHNKYKNKVIVFTLDDGYVDNLRNALPVFEKYNIPFTVYLCTGFPNKTAILWWYILDDIIMNNTFLEFDFKQNHYSFNVINIETKEKTFKILHKLCISCNESEMKELRVVFFDKYCKVSETILEEVALNWEQVIELSKNPLVTIGCHGKNHYPLLNFTIEEVEKELIESKLQIESFINKSVVHYSYPYGIIPNLDGNNYEIFKRNGFKSAVTATIGNLFFKNTNPYLLPRISLNPDMKIKDIRLNTSNIMPFLRNLITQLF